MSIRILIAEDEKVERQALRTLISRTFPELEITEDALNGIDLVRKATEYQPDIIITDIEMPGLNGLSAVSELKENGYTGKIVVQTAHSEFDYAQNAIEIDAEAYLLKPIKQEKVISVLTEIIGRITAEQQDIDDRRKQTKILEKAVPLIDAEIISSIQLNELQPDFLRSYLEQRGIPRSSFSICAICFADSDQGFRDISRHKQLSAACRKIRESAAEHFNLIIGNAVNGRIIILSGSEAVDDYQIKLSSITAAESILAKLRHESGGSTDFRIGISRRVVNILNLNTAYKESLTAARLCTQESPIQHYGDINPDTEAKPPVISGDGDLLNSILTDSPEKLEQQIDRYLNNPVLTRLKPSQLKDSLLDSFIDVFKQITALLPESSERIEIISQYLKELSACRGSEEVRSWFHKEIKNIADQYRKFTSERVHNCVMKARKYIEKNYMRNISLDIVAEEIGISPYHLSHLFKKQLNQNYIKYLTAVRISKAEELLRTGTYTLSELSSLAGYNNPSYFSKVFRKQTGKTLRESGGFCRIIREDPSPDIRNTKKQ